MAAKKNTKTSTKKCRGRGKQKTATPSSPKAADPPAHDPPAVYQAGRSQPSRSPSPPSGDDSRASRASSVDSVAESVASTSSHQPDGNTKKKRAKKSTCSMSVPDEELMLDFLQDNPVLWNMKMTDYRRTDKKGKIWDDQAQRMGKTSELLKGWFKSLRDTHTRLDRKKSGDGAPELTEREEWIMAKFGFLKTVIRHRPEPCNSVKATIDAHVGDLDAAEAACAEQEVGLQEADIIPTTHPSSGRKRARDDDGALLESLQKRVQESGEILKDLSHAHQQPVTERTAFATYVRDSLISMSKPKFKKARSAINKMLSQLMEEDSDDDIPRSIEDPVMSDPRPRSSAPSSSSVSAPSEMYQPPPHMWRHKAPPASVWGSQTQEYMEQYMQQPMQYQQRPAPQMMPPPLPALNQQQQQQHTSPSVSTTLGLAAEPLNQSPITFDNNISNTSNLSNISGLSGLINMSPVMDVDVDMNTSPAKK